MKAAVFYGRNDLRIEERPTPVPAEGEVLIRVRACGICGTDVHIFEGDEGAAQTPPGTVLGHEFSGEIAAAGPGVDGFAVGDRVCVDPNKYCGVCDACRSGHAHFCTGMIGYGTTRDGGFAEYCAVPVSQVYPIADSLSYLEAAMAEPVACCLHGIDQCQIEAGSTVLIIGGGMIGLLMLQLARLKGAAAVVLSEPVAEKRALAIRLGADLAFDPTAEDAARALRAHGVSRVDTVIECVGSPVTMAQAIELASPMATVMLFGLTKPSQEITIRPFDLFKREIVLKASYINPYTQKRAVALIQSGRLDVKSMMCPPAPLDELPAILSDPLRRSAGKYVILPCQEG